MSGRMKEVLVDRRARRRRVSGSALYAVVQLRREGIGREDSEEDNRKLRVVNSVGELEASIAVKR